MPKESLGQRKTEGRVMHEFKHGELKSGPGGKGGKVRSRKQAIAIALSEAGASKTKSKAENRRSLAKTKSKEARGKTAQQEAEGKSRIGAKGQRESSRAMGGKDAKKKTVRGTRAARSRARGDGKTKDALYARAKRKGIPNRSKLTKQQLENALAR